VRSTLTLDYRRAFKVASIEGGSEMGEVDEGERDAILVPG
jgi:hypothetical protein